MIRVLEVSARDGIVSSAREFFLAESPETRVLYIKGLDEVEVGLRELVRHEVGVVVRHFDPSGSTRVVETEGEMEMLRRREENANGAKGHV
jgi:hypothetical protein